MLQNQSPSVAKKYHILVQMQSWKLGCGKKLWLGESPLITLNSQQYQSDPSVAAGRWHHM